MAKDFIITGIGEISASKSYSKDLKDSEFSGTSISRITSKEEVVKGGSLNNHYTIKELDKIILSIAAYKSGKTELNDAWYRLLKLKDRLENE